MPTTRTKVLLVDDHDLIRRGLRHAFERDRQFEVVGEAATGAEAVEQALSARPDIALLDIEMPVFDGITAAAFAVMIPLIVADVAFGSGHFNLAQGIVGTATGIGASLSTVLGGYISDRFGSSTAFIGLACVAAAGLLLILLVMPETRRKT